VDPALSVTSAGSTYITVLTAERGLADEQRYN
jgi:hypothetical protein